MTREELEKIARDYVCSEGPISDLVKRAYINGILKGLELAAEKAESLVCGNHVIVFNKIPVHYKYTKPVGQEIRKMMGER